MRGVLAHGVLIRLDSDNADGYYSLGSQEGLLCRIKYSSRGYYLGDVNEHMVVIWALVEMAVHLSDEGNLTLTSSISTG